MSSDRLCLKPGDIVASTYRIEHTLGVGAMGVVVAATHVPSGTPVAIKYLLLEHADDAGLIRRFEREARAAARLQSEHVVRVFCLGTLVPDDFLASASAGRRDAPARGLPYIVMERLDGVDLATLLRERGPFDVHVVADYIAQACDALEEAHGLGLIHRDIKPGNLFVTRADATELIKVLDFGIVKLRSLNTAGETHQITIKDTLLGTLAYMSPEQMVDCASVDARSDIWSLGVTLYRLLTGVRPFEGKSVDDVARSIVHGSPARLETLRPDAPRGLDAVVQRCLQKRPEDRYPSVTALRDELTPFVSPFSWSAATFDPPTLRYAS